MSLTQAYTFKAPNRSNYDLSYAAFLSSDLGYVTPVSCIEVLANDSFTLNLGSIVETAPTFAPVYGRMHQSFRTFFVPRRLYSIVQTQGNRMPALFNPEGATEDTVQVLRFIPLSFTKSVNTTSSTTISGQVVTKGSDVSATAGYVLNVARGSIFEMLGLPVGYSANVLCKIIPFSFESYLTSCTLLNGIPLIAYIDLIYNYYSNHHAGFVPIRLAYYDTANETPVYSESHVRNLDIAKLSEYLNDVKTGRAAYITADFYLLSEDLTVVNSLYDCIVDQDPGFGSTLLYSFDGRHSGLSFCTPMPDINTSWISDTEYADWLAKAIVPVASNQVKYEDIITASSLYRRAAKLALGDGTFDDFYAAVNGVRADNRSIVPQYVGGFSRNLDFQQIRSTAETSEANLGSYAGYMSQATGGHLVNFFTREPGYLITIMTLYPEFTYGGGIESYLFKTRPEDFYSPDFSNIGYQPRLLAEVQAFSYVDYPEGSLVGTPSYGLSQSNLVVGYQPAWTEYTTAVNRSYGDLGPGGEKDFWTLHAPYVYGGFSFEYIDPSDFSYIFATNDLSVDNYFIQVGFNIKARRSIPKRLMPTLKL